MGHNPIPPRRPVTRESFHLGRLREAYARGEVTRLQLEQGIDHVLAGGHLSEDLRPVRVPEHPWVEDVPPEPLPRRGAGLGFLTAGSPFTTIPSRRVG